MKCPVCTTDLRMMERQGVEIDYCPQCRGVWLDRGELDKIIERSSAVETQEYRPPSGPEYREHEYRQHEHRPHEYRHDPRYKKKKSFLGDLFDFD